MFVSCDVKTILENRIQFIFNLDHLAVVEKIADENKVILNLQNGTFNFCFADQEATCAVYKAFMNLLNYEENTMTADIHLILL